MESNLNLSLFDQHKDHTRQFYRGCGMLCTLVIFFLILGKAVFAQAHESEPNLISPNLRLASMGNLFLIVNDYDNEINAFDFGGLSSGACDNDSGKSRLNFPLTCGFLKYNDQVKLDWAGYKTMFSGLCKIVKIIAVGGSVSKAYARTHVSGLANYSYYDDVACDTLIVGIKIFPQLTVGMRGRYYLDKTRHIFNGFDYESKHVCYGGDASMLMNAMSGRLSFGLQYQVSSNDSWAGMFDTSRTTTIIVPVIFISHYISVGLKGNFGSSRDVYRDSSYIINLNARCRIPIVTKNIYLGAILDRYVVNGYSPVWMDEFRGWHFNFGSGIAYEKEKFYFVGVQYLREIEYTRFEINPDLSNASHQQSINFGAELLLIKRAPIRLGYVVSKIIGSPSTVCIYATGFTYYLSEMFALTCAYNCRINNDPHGNLPPPKRHLLGFVLQTAF